MSAFLTTVSVCFAVTHRKPNHDTESVLSNSRGEAWTYNGFSTVWHRFKSALIEKGLTRKDLRHYSCSTNLADKNRKTMAKLEEENRRRADGIRLSHKSVNPNQNEDHL